MKEFSKCKLTARNLKILKDKIELSPITVLNEFHSNLLYFNLIEARWKYLKANEQQKRKDLICDQFDAIIDVAINAYKNEQMFKNFVKNRSIFDTKIKYPSTLPDYEKEWFKKIKAKLTKGVIHFCLNKVNKKAICSICYDELESIEKKGYSALVYTQCGHVVCEHCDSKMKKACPICRSLIQLRTLITINNNICAGLCCKPLSECKSLLLAECGHIYCTECKKM